MVETNTTEKTAIDYKPEKASWKKILYQLTLVVFVIGFIVMLAYAFDNQNSKIGWVFVAIFGVGILSYIIFHFFNVRGKLKFLQNKEGDKKTPEAVSEEYLKQKINENLLKNEMYMNDVKAIGDARQNNIGDNTIYTFRVYTLLETANYDSKTKNHFCEIIFNANYPERNPSILGISEIVNKQIINKVMNEMATKPKEEPDTFVSQTYDPETGRTSIHRERSRHKKTQAKKDKGGDLD